MNKTRVIWPKPVQNKIFSYHSKHFTIEETRRFLANWILEAEKNLLNPIISKTYTEEYGEYKGVSRIIVNKFKVYYECYGDDIVIVAVKFPGKN